jgi:hypothetical protein
VLSPLHATVNNLLCVLFIAESGHRVQWKSREQCGAGIANQGLPIKDQRKLLPARYTDYPPVITHFFIDQPLQTT